VRIRPPRLSQGVLKTCWRNSRKAGFQPAWTG